MDSGSWGLNSEIQSLAHVLLNDNMITIDALLTKINLHSLLKTPG